MHKIRFGIVGCGVISDWHARAIAAIPDALLVAVTDVRPVAAQQFAEKYKVIACEDLDELLASTIDAVCICTPSGMHAEQAIKAANAGKHIVLEKPIGITTPQLDAIVEACRRNKVRLTAVSQYVFSDAMQKLKSAVDEGKLGKLILGDITMKFLRTKEYYESATWRGTWALDGGGALMNQGIHGVGMLLHVMGPVKSVTAHTRTLLHNIEVEDTAVAILEFKNGALGQIVGTTSVYPGYPRVLQVTGSNGTVTLSEDKIIGWKLRDEPDAPVWEGQITDTSSIPTNFGIEGHKKQIEDFIAAIRGKRSPLVDEHVGRMAVDLVLAIYESSRTGRTVWMK